MRVRLPRLALLTVGALLALACSSSTTEPVAPTPTFTGQWQGQPWEGRASAFLVSHGGTADTLYILGANPVDSMYLTQAVVRARVEFHGVGQYMLDSTTVGFEQLTGGDVVSASYEGSGSPAGVLDITSYGGPSGVVEGTLSFGARLARSETNDVARFDNGQFRTTVRTALAR